MSIKEYVKIQSKKCKNKVMRNIFKDLIDVLYDTPKPKQTYTYPVTRNVTPKTPKKVVDIDSKRKIYILTHYDKNLKGATTTNMVTGYKSTISEDIVANNGDIYELVGIYQSYKFYKFKEEYFIRLEGSNVVTKINEYNYDKFKNFIESSNLIEY